MHNIFLSTEEVHDIIFSSVYVTTTPINLIHLQMTICVLWKASKHTFCIYAVTLLLPTCLWKQPYETINYLLLKQHYLLWQTKSKTYFDYYIFL